MTHELAFEDFSPGKIFDLGSLTLERDELLAFAREFDPQPFHLDEEAGRASILGGLAASGWQTAGLTQRLITRALLARSTCEGSPGITSLKWMRPVLAGDTLSARMTVLAARPLRSRPGYGMVTMLVETFNGAGELVMQYENPALFARRVEARP
ncbi:MaoC family dehydratase [Roseibium aestuarii]|uniref:MaoC family dehydratase n=1 Tax=Roseibium aestuarii TaxID=2600299 RepID=A0ABW4JVZ5_9HYPH|nr:MaoC family dehydratase [Roseibium aestuarii]